MTQIKKQLIIDIIYLFEKINCNDYCDFFCNCWENSDFQKNELIKLQTNKLKKIFKNLCKKKGEKTWIIINNKNQKLS